MPSLTSLSKDTKIPVSTIHDRVRRFKQCGIVKKYTALLDWEMVGLGCRAVVLLKAGKKDRQGLITALSKHNCVNCLIRVNNRWDYIAEFILPGIKEVEAFLEELEGQFVIKKRMVLYAIDEMKREGTSPQNRKV